MSLRMEEGMEQGLYPEYPERPGEPDCSYYMRTGLCKFGMTCKFNHPWNRKLAVAAVRSRGVYPERLGQPECQYYLKTGTCKFGATCKFHHPREKAGIAGRVQLNTLGYPLRPNEQECTYYLRTGQCKFGNICKFHHPQPSAAMSSLRGSLLYSNIHSPTSPSQQSYTGMTNWPLSRPPFIASTRWQGPSSFAQLILPQGLLQVPSWNAYAGQMGSLPSESQVHASGLGSISSYRTDSIPVGQYRMQREILFPERPGEPECQFYMKTGDCKFGATCKFHHPRERTIPIPDCMLSPLGLPLRPGEPLCLFYSRYGICKFGPNCKFDHPYGYAYGYASSSAEVPALQHSLASLPGSSERSTEAGLVKNRRGLLAESQQMAAGDRNNQMEGSNSTTSSGPVSSFS